MSTQEILRLVVFAGITTFIIKTQTKKPEEILKRQPNLFLRFKASGQPPELIRKIKNSAGKNVGATEVKHLAEEDFCVLNTKWTLLSFGYLITIAAEPIDLTSSGVALALYIKSNTNLFDGKVASNNFSRILSGSDLGEVEVMTEE